MEPDTKELVDNDYIANDIGHDIPLEEPTSKGAWVAVAVKNPSEQIINQIKSIASSKESSQNIVSNSKSTPVTIRSTTGNQVGYDMGMGSRPLQDSEFSRKLDAFGRGESPTHFVNHHQTFYASTGSSILNQNSQTAENSEIRNSRANLTIPVYQGGFGRLRPGYSSNRRELTYSVTANYYGDHEAHQNSYAAPSLEPSKRSQTKQSKRLPPWMRYLISKIIGVKTADNERMILGKALFVITIILCLLYGTTHTVFLVFNAKSSKTTLTTIEAALQNLNCFFGISLGIYANRLAVKLVGNQKLLDSIRMHTKSVLKIRASNWALILILGFLASDFYDRYMEIIKRPEIVPQPVVPTTVPMKMEFQTYAQGYVTSCKNVGLPQFVCTLDVYARLCFSIFAGLWNLLVLIVILSICRTHTIGIRRFIKELEIDGKVIESHYRAQVMDMNVDMFSVMMNEVDIHGNDSDEEYDNSWFQDYSPGNNEIPEIRNETPGLIEPGDSVCTSGPSDIRDHDAPLQRRPRVTSQDSNGITILSVNDILLRYWSINSRLCFTGMVIQRWVTCWIIFVIFWVAQMIVYWIKNDTEIQEIFMVAIPLILLPLLCSALSEINFEGDRLIRRLCPTSERLDLLFFISRNPMHLTIYGQTVRFGNMSNGLIGLATALFTGIAINQFMKTVK